MTYVHICFYTDLVYGLGMLWAAYALRDPPAPFSPRDLTWEDRLWGMCLWPYLLMTGAYND